MPIAIAHDPRRRVTKHHRAQLQSGGSRLAPHTLRTTHHVSLFIFFLNNKERAPFFCFNPIGQCVPGKSTALLHVTVAHGAQQTRPAPKRGAQPPRCHSGSVSHSHPRTGTGKVCSSELDYLKLKKTAPSGALRAHNPTTPPSPKSHQPSPFSGTPPCPAALYPATPSFPTPA